MSSWVNSIGLLLDISGILILFKYGLPSDVFPNRMISRMRLSLISIKLIGGLSILASVCLMSCIKKPNQDKIIITTCEIERNKDSIIEQNINSFLRTNSHIPLYRNMLTISRELEFKSPTENIFISLDNNECQISMRPNVVKQSKIQQTELFFRDKHLGIVSNYILQFKIDSTLKVSPHRAYMYLQNKKIELSVFNQPLLEGIQ